MLIALGLGSGAGIAALLYDEINDESTQLIVKVTASIAAPLALLFVLIGGLQLSQGCRRPDYTDLEQDHLQDTRHRGRLYGTFSNFDHQTNDALTGLHTSIDPQPNNERH